MADELRLYHKLLPFVFIPICFLIVSNWGFIGYVTFTQRPGFHGDLYYYYQLTRPQFYIYNFSVAAIAMVFVVCQLLYLLKDNSKKLTKTFWYFGVFLAFIILSEFYLASGFVGKG